MTKTIKVKRNNRIVKYKRWKKNPLISKSKSNYLYYDEEDNLITDLILIEMLYLMEDIDDIIDLDTQYTEQELSSYENNSYEAPERTDTYSSSDDSYSSSSSYDSSSSSYDSGGCD